VQLHRLLGLLVPPHLELGQEPRRLHPCRLGEHTIQGCLEPRHISPEQLHRQFGIRQSGGQPRIIAFILPLRCLCVLGAKPQSGCYRLTATPFPPGCHRGARLVVGVGRSSARPRRGRGQNGVSQPLLLLLQMLLLPPPPSPAVMIRV